MTKVDEVYKCEVCGNVTEVVECGGGPLVCCGKPMNLLEAKAASDEGNEKHVPVISVEGNTVTVAVGSVSHPMEDNHWIEWIELLRDGKVIAAAKLYPSEEPKAVFTVENGEGVTARELCNKHGLWQS